MKKLTLPLLVVSIFFLGGSIGLANYKTKDLHIKPAQEYGSRQDLQNIVIGAYPCKTEARTLARLDTGELHKRQILPTLVVVENNNEFAIRIPEQEIILVTREGTNLTALPYPAVLLHINLYKPPTSYSTQLPLNRIGFSERWWTRR